MKQFCYLLLVSVVVFSSVSCETNQSSTNMGEQITDPIPFGPLPPDIAPAFSEFKILQRSVMTNDQGIQSSNSNLEPNRIIGELGQISITQVVGEWHTLEFLNQFRNPVVIMQPLSYFGGDPAMIRVRNVTNRQFEFQIKEWDYLDGGHPTEIVSYLVMETGIFTNGLVYEVGKINTNQTFKTVDLQLLSPNKAVILTQVGVFCPTPPKGIFANFFVAGTELSH